MYREERLLAKRLKVAVIFGGRSAEHEVSLVSATSVIEGLDPAKYEVIPVGITREGRWICHPDALEMLKEGRPPADLRTAVIAEPAAEQFLVLSSLAKNPRLLSVLSGIDVFFPVLHGTFGEDGTVQGLFELMGKPYVGAGVLGSAVGMDKVIQKRLLKAAKLPVVDFLSFRREDNPADPGVLRKIKARLRYPIFVKPANLGSSVGISRVRSRDELIRAMELAFEYDRKIILEQGLENPREIEVSVLGNEQPRASVPGEVIPSRDFYDYEAKYIDGKSQLKIPAELPGEQEKLIRDLAVQAFKLTDCEGMARVDFLVKDRQVYVSELNTIPGFTAISMYPKLWEASGLPFSELLDELIRLALERHRKKSALRTHPDLQSDWYRR